MAEYRILLEKIKLNKLYIIPLVLILSLGFAMAAVTECIDSTGAPVADNTGAWPAYNDTGVITNVSDGNVCVNVTDYDIDPTSSYYCDWFVECITGECIVNTYFVGYDGTGADVCSLTDSKQIGGQSADNGYMITTTANTTIGTTSCLAYETLTQNTCTNGYTTAAYCDTSALVPEANVSAGNVCILGVDSDPDITNKCANWINYTIGSCTTGIVYVGYAGDGTSTCVLTGYVVGVGSGVVSTGYRINTTIIAPSSMDYLTNTGGTASYTTCTNAYTRNGTTGYCDTGVQQVGTLHVADGKVCAAGTNVAPNSTSNCGTWYECVLGETSYPDYYVGYAGAGTDCSETAWVATGSVYSLLAGTAISFTANGPTSCEANFIADSTPVTNGIGNVKNLAYAGFGILVVGILAVVAFGLMQLFRGGNVDFMSIAIFAITTGVIIMVAYLIIYFVSSALGA